MPADSEPLMAPARNIHPVWRRLTHWLNAVAVVVLVASGWRIYNATRFFDFAIPSGITLGGWLDEAATRQECDPG